MGEYCHRREYPLRYSDYDFKDELRLSSLLALTQEAACSSADELGFGYEALKPQHLGFIIVQTYCKLLAPVPLCDVLTVETWPLPPRHVIFERHYRVLNGKGEEAALAASRWCLVDLENFTLNTPARLQEVHERCPYRNERTVEPPAWKIPKLENEGREVLRTEVRNTRCDHYFHANNTYYADFFLDCFTMEELAAMKISAFQISYVKQAKEGALLLFYRKDVADGVILEAREGEELIAQFRIYTEETA